MYVCTCIQTRSISISQPTNLNYFLCLRLIRISKVNSASTQVVSGTLYKINVDLIAGNNEVKNCNVEIWSQPWLPEGIQVTFDCEGEEKIVRKHSA